jgi:hypothetical protein
MRMRRTLVLCGAVVAVTLVAVAPAWLSAPSSPASSPAPRATSMPQQLAGVQWDECMIQNLVPAEVSGFTVNRDGGRIGVEVQDS